MNGALSLGRTVAALRALAAALDHGALPSRYFATAIMSDTRPINQEVVGPGRRGFLPGFLSWRRYSITALGLTSQSWPGLIPGIVPVCNSLLMCLGVRPASRAA